MVNIEGVHLRPDKKTTCDNSSSLDVVYFKRTISSFNVCLESWTEQFIVRLVMTKEES